MSPFSSLPDRLKGGKPVISAWCGLPEPSIAGLLAREDFDTVVLDMQHGAIDFAAVVRAIPLVAAAGKPAIARIPVGEFATASRLLDAGASAIIAPMINSVEDAKKFAGFTKFPPIGERSWGPNAALTLSGMNQDEYLQRANGACLSLAMIETNEAFAALDDILAVEGIDGVFIGPADLSIALSKGKKVEPMGKAVDDALAVVIERTRKAGKAAAVFGHTPERSAQLAKMGFGLVALVSDGYYLRSGAAAALKIARG